VSVRYLIGGSAGWPVVVGRSYYSQRVGDDRRIIRVHGDLDYACDRLDHFSYRSAADIRKDGSLTLTFPTFTASTTGSCVGQQCGQEGTLKFDADLTFERRLCIRFRTCGGRAIYHISFSTSSSRPSLNVRKSPPA
jgi:hypothetical protein